MFAVKSYEPGAKSKLLGVLSTAPQKFLTIPWYSTIAKSCQKFEHRGAVPDISRGLSDQRERYPRFAVYGEERPAMESIVKSVPETFVADRATCYSVVS